LQKRKTKDILGRGKIDQRKSRKNSPKTLHKWRMLPSMLKQKGQIAKGGAGKKKKGFKGGARRGGPGR